MGSQASTSTPGEDNADAGEDNESEEGGCELEEDAVDGTDGVCQAWFWGHANSSQEPPPAVPAHVSLLTQPLRLANSGKYDQDFAEYAMCPHFLDKQAQNAAPGQGCPFLGGQAFLRHDDVQQRLAQVPGEHVAGTITRKNELGYLILTDAAFLKADGKPGGTLSLGNSVEDHRIQRQWIEKLLDPRKLPSREQWKDKVREFLEEKRSHPNPEQRKFKFQSAVSTWWQRMLFKVILNADLTEKEAKEFVKFQKEWLVCSLLPGPKQFLDSVLGMEGFLKLQQQMCEKVQAKLPADVPEEHRSLVARGILEMFVFAGGLSIPQTIHCSACVLFTRKVLPSPADKPFVLDESNVEAFVYEVTRLFPAVQGFCYWRGDTREILSLNAALRDPAVWGPDANCFKLRPVELYRKNHVGFAQPAKSAAGTFDSKACPGYNLSLDVVQAFMLVLAERQPQLEHNGPSKMNIFWSPVHPPKPAGDSDGWWKDFTLQIQDCSTATKRGRNCSGT